MSAPARQAVPVVEVTEGCRFCWMCRQACPVGHVTASETLTPHGWALAIASVKRGTLAWNAESADVLYKCADCGLCRAHCVTDQPLPEAIALARVAVAEAGLAPKAAYDLQRRLEEWGGAHGPAGAATRDTGEVGIFVGDAGGAAGAGTLDAAVALLDAAGIRTVRVAPGRSTGAVASSLGFPSTARALADAVIGDVEASRCRTLLVLGPGERYAFERLYRDRLNVAWPAGVEVREVTGVLADALAGGRLAFRRTDAERPYAYQDPDETARLGRDGAAPRALLAAALGAAGERRLFWRDGRAHPTGAGGGLDVTQPELAAALAQARFADARAAGATLLVTEDPASLQMLQRHRPPDIEVAGLYELLRDHMA